MKKDVVNRKDVVLLVATFYDKIKKDTLLGPIFNGMIENWEQHIEHLTNFWCSQLLFERSYYGNPIEIHRKVDEYAHQKIDEHYFGR